MNPAWERTLRPKAANGGGKVVEEEVVVKGVEDGSEDVGKPCKPTTSAA